MAAVRAYAPAPVEGVPGLSLAADAISMAEEADIIARLEAGDWSAQLTRATQQFGATYHYATRRLLAAPPVPDWLAALAPFAADQILVNKYEPGQGIAPHTDDARHFGPRVAALSLGSDVTMDWARGDRYVALRAPRRSLVVFEGEARERWTHGIAARASDVVGGRRVRRGVRYSVTFRTLRG